MKELHSRGVHFVKVWVDDRAGSVPKVQPKVYRAIIAEAHANGMEVLVHLGQTTGLAGAKDLLQAGVDGFVHVVRDRDVDDEYLSLVKAHPKTWTGPNIPVPNTKDTVDALAETLPATQIARMRQQLQQREANGNPPNALYELHCRNFRKIHEAGMVIGLGTDGTARHGAPNRFRIPSAERSRRPSSLHPAPRAAARSIGWGRLPRKAAGFNVLDANP